MLAYYKRVSVRVCGKLIAPFSKSFAAKKRFLREAQIEATSDEWAAIAVFSSLQMLAVSAALAVWLYAAHIIDLVSFVYFVFFMPAAAFSSVFLSVYYYPSQKAKSIAKSIELDLPFALSQMSAIASAGVSVEYMFELVAGFREYRAMSKQAQIIVRAVKELGMSSSKAIEHLGQLTPSKQFREVLSGISGTVEKGGNLSKYLSEMADKLLFDYRNRRDEYQKTLSVFTDVYLVLSIAGPFLMLFVLSSLLIAGSTLPSGAGEVFGLPIEFLIGAVMPAFIIVSNLAFLLVLHITQPGV